MSVVKVVSGGIIAFLLLLIVTIVIVSLANAFISLDKNTLNVSSLATTTFRLIRAWTLIDIFRTLMVIYPFIMIIYCIVDVFGWLLSLIERKPERKYLSGKATNIYAKLNEAVDNETVNQERNSK